MTGVTPIMLALYNGDRVRAEELARDVELNVFEAAALGETGRLCALLDEEASLASAWSPDGFTPLHYAAFFDQPESARVLVERGADLEAQATNQEFAPLARPLHSAVAGRARDVVRVLLEAGADANAEQHGGFTPLSAAQQHDDTALVELLREFGASR